MNKYIHRLYILSMTAVVIGITYYIATTGYSYYSTPIHERFYHPEYDWYKPSGIFGQGLGILGTALITFGVAIYIVRKRYGFMERWIRLKYLLEFHIFLCTLGPILVLFHTTFKFGGIVAIAFWSMVAVVLSGVVGRFIYIQIPRTIEGRALSIQEVQQKRHDFENQIKNIEGLKFDTIEAQLKKDNNNWGISTYFKNLQRKKVIRRVLKQSTLSKKEKVEVMSLVSEEMALSSRIGRLEQMKNLFKYWHVVHMPFAIIMLIIVLIHIGVTVALGYKWIF